MNCGLCVGLYAENRAMLLVGIWWQENKNKLVECNALDDTMGMKGANLEDKFFVPESSSFLTPIFMQKLQRSHFNRPKHYFQLLQTNEWHSHQYLNGTKLCQYFCRFHQISFSVNTTTPNLNFMAATLITALVLPPLLEGSSLNVKPLSIPFTWLLSIHEKF